MRRRTIRVNGETPNERENRLDTLARLARYNIIRLIEPQVAWRSETELSTSYGDWDEARKLPTDSDFDLTKTFALIELCGGSDYSGSLVEVSNHKAMLEAMPEGFEDGTEYLSYSGGHGTFALAIQCEALVSKDEDGGLLESIESLEDYCLLDESLHSELEIEAQNEAWDNWAKSDFKKALGEAMFSAFEASSKAERREDETEAEYEARIEDIREYLEDECAEIDDTNLVRLWIDMSERANLYWENEQGSSVYIDVEDVVKRGLEAPREADPSRHASWVEYRASSHKALIEALRNAMSERKYDLGLVRYIDPNQLNLPLTA